MPTHVAADAAGWCGKVHYGCRGTPPPPTAPTWTAHWKPCSTGWQRYPKRHCSAPPWRVVGGAGRAGRAHTLMNGLRPAIPGARVAREDEVGVTPCRAGLARAAGFERADPVPSTCSSFEHADPGGSGHSLCEDFPILCFFIFLYYVNALLCASPATPQAQALAQLF